jgi:hypothetical protein
VERNAHRGTGQRQVHLRIRTREAVFGILVVSLVVSAQATAAEPLEFNRDIRPILADHCFACHGPDRGSRKADLRLDQRDAAVKAEAISEKQPKKSELIARIFSNDSDVVMPPPEAKKPLTAEQKERLKRWVIEGAKYQQHWAFVPPQRTPPQVKNEAWRTGIVDPYVMARLEKEGRKPGLEADRRTLIRRVTFDLTGLPPSLPEIEAFLKDDSPDAYARMVNHLLKKPAYGEHMARYWADLVRLADTNGMHKDFYRNFSTYRSWLIRAFNDNLRFDDFIRYQVAGDIYEKPTEDQLIASGFNRLHLIIDRGTALPEESHHKNVLDRVEAFGTAFLGLTVQCAQCHEHKYDPISQKEFYGLYAFFNNLDGAPETSGAPKGGIQQPAVKLSAADAAGKLAMVMKERDQPKPTFLLIRGAYDDPGEEVQRGTPAFLPALKQKDGHSSRMDLAEWLTDLRHPLTARVTVNRLWQQFFGVGLVKTSEDFGTRGEWPSHRELLDELALSFVESNWDVKKLVRAILLSKTYRQSSDAKPGDFARDPENRLLARGPRYRMDAEMIRDQILFLSGKLNLKMYGESVKPPQPAGLWKAVSMAAPFTYVPDKGDAIYRRSFYTYWRRAMPPPQMTILNAPSREFCTTRRERTNTPLQALLMMNEQEYFNSARSCAALTLKEASGDEEKGLGLLYEKVTSHRPGKEQRQLLRETLSAFREIYSEDKALTELVTPELAGSEFAQRVDLAAWSMLTHSLLNLEVAKVKR